jgi:hypothetical protein
MILRTMLFHEVVVPSSFGPRMWTQPARHRDHGHAVPSTTARQGDADAGIGVPEYACP